MALEEVEFEDPSRGQIAVRMAAAGVCHTDLHILDSDDGWGKSFPLILGHEGSGVVEEVGPEVHRLEVGDHVAIACRVPCGSCPLCRRGDTRRCSASSPSPATIRTVPSAEPVTPPLGIGLFAERVVVDAGAAVRIQRSFPLDQAGILGCALMTGVGAATNTARVFPGATVAVMGCGGIGLAAVQGARVCGAARIVAVDVAPDKLEWARSLGATDTIDASGADPVAAVLGQTEGVGVDFAFEAVGSKTSVAQCLRMLTTGGVLTIIGVPPREAKLELALGGSDGIFAKTSTIMVSHGGDSLPQHDLPTLCRLSDQGLLDIKQMITHRVPLSNIDRGFELMKEAASIRAIVDFDRDNSA